MYNPVYRFRPGSRLKGDSQAIGERLTTLAGSVERFEQIKLKPTRVFLDSVIKDARRSDSPLHGLFPWDLRKAARLCWEDIARHLARSVEVEYIHAEEVEGEEVQISSWVPALIHIKSAPEVGSTYAPIARVMNDDELYQQVLDECRAAMSAFARKYRRFSQVFPEVFRAINEAIEGVPA